MVALEPQGKKQNKNVLRPSQLVEMCGCACLQGKPSVPSPPKHCMSILARKATFLTLFPATLAFVWLSLLVGLGHETTLSPRATSTSAYLRLARVVVLAPSAPVYPRRLRLGLDAGDQLRRHRLILRRM